MTLRDVLLCTGFSLALPMGQIMFKWAAVTSERLTGPLPIRLLTNLPLMGAFAWYGVTALIWFYILTRVPLSLAYSFSMIGAALVPLAAWLIFHEPLGWRIAVGYALMLTGFLIIMQGQAAH